MFKFDKKTNGISDINTNEIIENDNRVNNVEENSGKNKMKFFNLTPIKKSQQNYFDILDDRLADPEIKNVAISGPYASGKSTIIKSYFDKINKKTMYISLATYNGVKEKKTGNVTNGIAQEILKQIAAKYMKKNRKEANKIYAIIAAIVGIGIIFINKIKASIKYLNYYFSIWTSKISRTFDFYKYDIVEGTYLNLIIKSVLLLLANILILCILFLLVMLSATLINKILNSLSQSLNFNINCIKFGKIEFDFDDVSVNPFEKNLKSLIKIFEKNNIEYLVLEDIDRFNDIDIYVELKQLNLMLNSAIKTEKDKKIVFIYAMKNDLLDGVDQSKMFDFIMPVVPFASYYNMSDILLADLERHGLGEHFDKEFIMDLCNYCNDYRVISNIFNEYIVYQKNRNDNIDITEDKKFNTKLLCILVYKNLSPKDFEKLRNREGCLFSIFEKLNEDYLKELNNLKENVKDEKSKKRLEQMNKYGIFYGINSKKIFDKIVEYSNGLHVNEDYQYSEEFLCWAIPNGYIDENYSHLISKESSYLLTQNGNRFLDGINGTRHNYDLQLDPNDMPIIKSRMRARDYNKETALNHCFISYMIHTSEDLLIRNLIDALCRSDKTIHYINVYMKNHPDDFNVLINTMCHCNDGNLRCLLDRSGDALEQDEVLYRILTDKTIITSDFFDDSFRIYIGNAKSFIESGVYIENPDTFFKALKEDYNVQYYDICNCKKEWLPYIVENNLYEINDKNINAICNDSSNLKSINNIDVIKKILRHEVIDLSSDKILELLFTNSIANENILNKNIKLSINNINEILEYDDSIKTIEDNQEAKDEIYKSVIESIGNEELTEVSNIAKIRDIVINSKEAYSITNFLFEKIYDIIDEKDEMVLMLDIYQSIYSSDEMEKYLNKIDEEIISSISKKQHNLERHNACSLDIKPEYAKIIDIYLTKSGIKHEPKGSNKITLKR